MVAAACGLRALLQPREQTKRPSRKARVCPLLVGAERRLVGHLKGDEQAAMGGEVVLSWRSLDGRTSGCRVPARGSQDLRPRGPRTVCENSLRLTWDLPKKLTSVRSRLQVLGVRA